MKRSIHLLVALATVLGACTAGAPAAPPPTVATTVTPTTTTTVTTTTTPATTTTTEDDGYPVVVASGNGDVTIPSRPMRIVSLSPSATETLFAIGAGEQVVAVDSFSYFPSEAPVQEDLSAFEPNVEAIVDAYQPDLVVLSWDPGNVIAAFEVLEVPVLLQGAPYSFEDAYAQWEQLGAATGHLAEAVALVNETQDTINEAVAHVGNGAEGLSMYHELDPTLYSITSTTFLGSLYARFGLVNVADDADPDGWGYPQLSAEYLVERSPDVVFFTTCCGDDATTIATRPGWATITAVASSNVFALDYDVASRWGPRLAQLSWSIAEALSEVTVTTDA